MGVGYVFAVKIGFHAVGMTFISKKKNPTENMGNGTEIWERQPLEQ